MINLLYYIQCTSIKPLACFDRLICKIKSFDKFYSKFQSKVFKLNVFTLTISKDKWKFCLKYLSILYNRALLLAGANTRTKRAETSRNGRILIQNKNFLKQVTHENKDQTPSSNSVRNQHNYNKTCCVSPCNRSLKVTPLAKFRNASKIPNFNQLVLNEETQLKVKNVWDSFT